jgi:hypothetical protein
MPNYRLLTETGKDLGPFRAGSTEWGPGDRIFLGRDLFEVVNLTEALDGDDVDGYLIVKAA